MTPLTESGRVAVITAAADGIGQATAIAFARAGYRLTLVDIDEAGVSRTARECSPAETVVVTADVTQPAPVADVVHRTLATLGRVDVLVNVVGGSRPGKATTELTLDEWNEMLALNLTSVFLMCQAFLPHLEARETSAIVNVSSGAGLRGMRRNPGYVAAKAGVAAFTRALAIDHAGNGVRANCVAPGPIRTPLMRRNRTPEEIAAMGSLALAGRIGEPEEIAAAILWLAGDAASYVMGQTLAVDGGVASMI